MKTPPWQRYLEGLHASGSIRPYQQAWLQSALNGTKSAMLGARQIGKGWTVALIAVTLAHGYASSDGTVVPPHDVLVLSKDLRTSRNMIAMIRKHIDLCEKMFGRISSTRLGGQSEIYLSGRGKIVSMPGTPRSAQGFTGSVIIDELAANKWDPEELVAQGLSVASSKPYFRFVMISNAGVSGGFAHMFFHGDGEWEKRREDFTTSDTNIYDAYPDGLPDRLKSLRKTISPKMWGRFFENSFEAGGAGIIERFQVPAVTGLPARYSTILSVDPGFVDNPTGVVVLCADHATGNVTVAYSDWWFGVSIDDQADRIIQLQKFWRPQKTMIDKGFAGFSFQAKFQHDPSVTFLGVNGPNKQRMLAGLIDFIESGRLRVLTGQQPSGIKRMFGDPEILWQDLETIQWADNGQLDVGVTLVRAGSAEAIARGATVGTKIHADTAMAMAYCADWMAGIKTGGVTPMRPGSGLVTY